MPYTVQFVGVICFLRQNGGRLAMMADGRRFTPRHVARIELRRADIRSESGWTRSPLQVRRGQFVLPQCSLTIEGADQRGAFDATQQELHLPRLQVLENSFQIDPAAARTVATIPIRQGTLRAFRYPASPDLPHISVISELTVPHDGTITVTATPRNGAPPQTILLEPGTEIVIVNDSMSLGRGQNHFHIYDQLNTAPPPRVSLGQVPPPTPPPIPRSMSEHPAFNRLIDGNDSCPNTGCCP